MPAPGPRTASARPPGNSTVAASRANPRFMEVTVCRLDQVSAAIEQDRARLLKHRLPLRQGLSTIQLECAATRARTEGQHDSQHRSHEYQHRTMRVFSQTTAYAISLGDPGGRRYRPRCDF